MNGYDSVNLCKPALHSGKGLQGGLSSLYVSGEAARIYESEDVITA